MRQGNSKRGLNPKYSLRRHMHNRPHNPSPRRRTRRHIRRRTIRGQRTIPRRRLNRQRHPLSQNKLKVRVSPRPSSNPKSNCSHSYSHSTPSSSPRPSLSLICSALRLSPFKRSLKHRRRVCRNNIKLKPRRHTRLLKHILQCNRSRKYKNSRR